MQQPGRDQRLGGRRLSKRARQTRNEIGVENPEDRGDRHQNQGTPDKSFSAHYSGPEIRRDLGHEKSRNDQPFRIFMEMRSFADMVRPWMTLDAILQHVASWGDRNPHAR